MKRKFTEDIQMAIKQMKTFSLVSFPANENIS